MSNASLAPIANRLGKLVPLLSSNLDGEVVAAARAIGRALVSVGADWHDLTEALTKPSPSHPGGAGRDQPQAMAAWLATCRDLTDWEANFVASLSRRLRAGRSLTPRQTATLTRIYLERGGPGE